MLGVYQQQENGETIIVKEVEVAEKERYWAIEVEYGNPVRIDGVRIATCVRIVVSTGIGVFFTQFAG